ncbi:universal stress protein [Enterococcus raffinosus]|uniref:universal stress protein n=1 Tax=Enterococcus raffinosus TaxID=71452 RepID=UPI003ACAC62D
MVKKYQKVLVAVDGSVQSISAIYEAVDFVKESGGGVFVLLVTDVLQIGKDSEVSKIIEEDMTALQEQVMSIIDNTVFYRIIRKIGTPKTEIVKFADSEMMDLIVIGSTGRHGLEKVLIGSTTSYVVSNASCNVLVVR